MKGSVDVVALLLLAGAISLAVAGQMLMKWGMSAQKVSEIGQLVGALFTARVLAGLLCFVISAMLWLVVLSRLDLSYVYPMVALGQVAVMFLSWLLLKEHLTALRIVGMGVICMGVLCVALSYGMSSSESSPDTDATSAQQQ
ncbi:MAG: EamA family transporter [Armatimonadota bacterium]